MPPIAGVGQHHLDFDTHQFPPRRSLTRIVLHLIEPHGVAAHGSDFVPKPVCRLRIHPSRFEITY
jgi:hypothetical protein